MADERELRAEAEEGPTGGPITRRRLLQVTAGMAAADLVVGGLAAVLDGGDPAPDRPLARESTTTSGRSGSTSSSTTAGRGGRGPGRDTGGGKRGGEEEPDGETPAGHDHGQPGEEPADEIVPPEQAPVETAMRWSNPDTWGGKIPGAGDIAQVDRPILLDVDATVAGVVISPRGSLVFEPQQSRTLLSTGNVVVSGVLQMKPAAAAVTHTMRFLKVDERKFVGGGTKVLATDVGLWVIGKGVLAVAGTPKRAWTRATGGISRGARQVALRDAPTGWRVGDEVLIAPTGRPGQDHHLAHDISRIVAVDGRTVTLATPTRHDHPAVTVKPGRTYTAEVLNLTRNVVIGGTPAGQSHVMIMSARRHRLSHGVITHAGPRQKSEGRRGQPDTQFVLGRYGLHFHVIGNATRGSVVDGFVIRDTESHAFVAHASHGITFKDCIADNTTEMPYWWDVRLPGDDVGPKTNDARYDRCVASRTHAAQGVTDHHLAAFLMGAGKGNVAKDCVVFGLDGGSECSGFTWSSRSRGVWTFDGCVSHNNKQHGIFVWQNTSGIHQMRRFTGYHNGGAGIVHGAYRNCFRYSDCALYGNNKAGVDDHALSSVLPLEYSGLYIDGGGVSKAGFLINRHVLDEDTPVRVRNSTLRGAEQACVRVVADQSTDHFFDFVECRYSGNEFWLDDGVTPGSRIRVQNGGKAFELTRKGMTGPGWEPRPEWNASRRQIKPFA